MLLPLPHDRPRRVVGCMTGTSLDGLDVAFIEFDGVGINLTVRSIQHAHASLGSLRDDLRRALNTPLSVASFAHLGRELGVLHAETIRRAWPGLLPDLVVAHGQTLMHRPPLSLQLLNPWPIATMLGCAVVSDLRGRLLADGAEGAPITPMADRILYKEHLSTAPFAIVNLGGFANATVLSKDTCVGFDCCPCNHLLDAASRARLGRPFDDGGAVACSGSPDHTIATSIAHDMTRLHREQRSGGTGDESAQDWQPSLNEHTPADHLATLAEAIGIGIALTLRDVQLTRVVLAGGGAHNRAVAAAITRHTKAPTESSDALGVPIEAREAAGMATLGLLAADGVSINFGETSSMTDGQWVFPRRVQGQ